MAFLDGLPPEKLCQPIVDHFTQRGGEIRCHAHLSRCTFGPLDTQLILHLAYRRLLQHNQAYVSSLAECAYSASCHSIMSKLWPAAYVIILFMQDECQIKGD